MFFFFFYSFLFFFFFFNDTATTEIYTLSLHDALPISPKLEFAEGSFDELVDYIEQFVIEDDEGEA